MQRPLNQLAPGTHFRLPDLGLVGRLIAVNDCRARVRIEQPPRWVEFADPGGTRRGFLANRSCETSWAPTVVVEALSVSPGSSDHGDPESAAAFPELESSPMPRSRSQTASRPAGGMSQLTAAVKVLTEAGTPLSTRAMIEAMAANNYWTSPGGQTPHATLYAAILREIAQRGTAARFEKVDRGLFQLRATACQPAATKAKPSRKATRR